MEQSLSRTSKGQTSFEMLLVVAVTISVAIFILGNYFELDDSTIAISLLKTRTLSRFAEMDSHYVIKKIDYEEPTFNTINLNITTIPSDLQGYPDSEDADKDADEIANEILSKTSYSTITIAINGNLVYS